MKKYRILFLMMIAAGLVYSCANEPLEEIGSSTKESVSGENLISASLEQHTDTKTTLSGNGTDVLWSEGDSFASFGADGSSAKFTLTSGAGTTVGTFSGTFAGEAPYTLLYPWSDKASLSEGWLCFALPQQQAYKADTFAEGSNPTVAVCEADGAASFRNLCGVLKLTVKGHGQQLKKIVLQDLAGNMLWGDASVKIDGKQGTADQTFTLEGGDNNLILTMNNVTINTSTPKNFYFIVPQGTLDRGFSIAFHTIQGEVYGFLGTQVNNSVGRSEVVVMPTATTSEFTEPAKESARGFYKDLFMDSGIYLTSRSTLPAAEELGLSMEYFKSNDNKYLNNTDTVINKQIFFGSTEDLNGVLLYPDGEPRFRVIYMNGGNSRTHGASLYKSGTSHIQTFFQNGGSYTGSCAGSFYASKGYDNNYPYVYYSSLWPGHTYHTKTDAGVNVENAYTRLSVEPGCPLLNYYDLGNMIYNVRHNGGSYIKPTDSDFPAGTEILMRYYTPDSTLLHNQVNAWAYKPSESSGRLVVSGSHPESHTAETSKKQLEYMASMIAYALDGVALGDIKDIAQNEPAENTIGDRQYHHYKFTLSADTENVKIILSSDADADLYLTLRKGDRAYLTESQWALATDGASKTLYIKSLEAGGWYIGVYCNTIVTSTLTTYSSSGAYYKYSGKTDILNGAPYSLTLTSDDRMDAGNEEFEDKGGEWL